MRFVLTPKFFFFLTFSSRSKNDTKRRKFIPQRERERERYNTRYSYCDIYNGT